MVGVLKENERKQCLRTPPPGLAGSKPSAGAKLDPSLGKAPVLPGVCTPHARRGRKRSPPTCGGAWESECSGLGASRSQAGDEDVPRPVNSLAASWASVPSLRSAGGRRPAEPRPPPAGPLPAARPRSPRSQEGARGASPPQRGGGARPTAPRSPRPRGGGPPGLRPPGRPPARPQRCSL